MSTKAMRMLCETVANDPRMGNSFKDAAREALAEVEAIEKAADAVVEWNRTGRPPLSVDAARGYDVLERITDERKEHNALRERVQALEAERERLKGSVREAQQYASEAVEERNAAESRLAAIRQRAGGREDLGAIVCNWLHQRTETGGPGTSFSDCGVRVARYVLGEDATGVERKTFVGIPERAWQSPAPTTAEDFATVRAGISRWAVPTERLESAAAALARIEARVGALVRVAEVASRPLMDRDLLRLREEAAAALTDAPPVFTLGEVEMLERVACECPWRVEATRDNKHAAGCAGHRVREAISALRKG